MDDYINEFIMEWCPGYVAHLVDSDDNAGERLRAKAREYRAAGMRELIEILKEYRVTVTELGMEFQYVSVRDFEPALARLLESDTDTNVGVKRRDKGDDL